MRAWQCVKGGRLREVVSLSPRVRDREVESQGPGFVRAKHLVVGAQVSRASRGGDGSPSRVLSFSKLNISKYSEYIYLDLATSIHDKYLPNIWTWRAIFNSSLGRYLRKKKHDDVSTASLYPYDVI